MFLFFIPLQGNSAAVDEIKRKIKMQLAEEEIASLAVDKFIADVGIEPSDAGYFWLGSVACISHRFSGFPYAGKNPFPR